jgi:hypothetical protein
MAMLIFQVVEWLGQTSTVIGYDDEYSIGSSYYYHSSSS